MQQTILSFIYIFFFATAAQLRLLSMIRLTNVMLVQEEKQENLHRLRSSADVLWAGIGMKTVGKLDRCSISTVHPPKS